MASLSPSFLRPSQTQHFPLANVRERERRGERERGRGEKKRRGEKEDREIFGYRFG